MSRGCLRQFRGDLRYTKWGGKKHWNFRAEPLGSDRYGWWYGCPAGIPMRRGLEEPIIVNYDFIVLAPAEGGWVGSWNNADKIKGKAGESLRAHLAGPASWEIEVYIDVTAEPVRTAESVEAVDLDLDVVRLRDGSVRLLDEDEFEEHQILYGYPADVIAQARATADDLMEMVAARREPFGEVGDSWLA
jgi:hypothetical protein